MKTDKQLFLIFSRQPQWVFEIAGLESPGECSMQSVTFKEIEQEADGVIVPVEPTKPLSIVEFQFQKDRRIYSRAVVEMALLQDQHEGRDVEGMIFFRTRSLDPKTRPWAQVVRSYYLDELLPTFAERSPTHPLVAVLQPIWAEERALEAHAKDYYHQIRMSKLTDELKETLLDVFINWLGQRLINKGRKEIEMLLIGELPDFRDTKCGQDLLRDGLISGRRQTIIELLEDRFGSVPVEIQKRIEAETSEAALKQLARKVLRVTSLDELN